MTAGGAGTGTGNGGGITLTSGVGGSDSTTQGNSGNIVLKPGTVTTGGTIGQIQIQNAAGSAKFNFEPDATTPTMDIEAGATSALRHLPENGRTCTGMVRATVGSR